ncbi:DUF4236 domain-containing protein [Chryseobacterium cucumeris]|nr:DUF4236 domain-containing protein [Chryseobacterium cucumeris]
MAWSYRKRIKVIPGVHLNFSKRGIQQIRYNIKYFYPWLF